MADESVKKKRTKLLVAIAVIAAIAVCCGGAYLYFSAQEAKTYGVPIVVNAEGLDTEKGTKIPVHATGKDSKGNDVDSMFYSGESPSDIALKPGDYSLAIEASPIAEDGTIYDTKDAVTKVSIAKDGKTDVEKEITVAPIPAEKVTDEQIEAAYNAAKDSGIDISKLDELKERAQKRRDDAVAAEKAAEEKAAEKKNAAQNSHLLTTDYFYVDVLPDYWNPSDWTVKQIDDHTWEITRQPANDYGGAISISVAKDNPWPQSGTQGLGATGTGLNVYMGNGAGAGLAKYLKVELTKTWNPDDPDSIRADGSSNSEYQDMMDAREWLKQQQTGGNN